MAEPVVSVALETIRCLLVQEVKFYCGVRSQFEEIQQELLRMRSFLKDADSKQVTDIRVHNWVSEVREAAYDIEDSILIFFAVKIASRKFRSSRNVFKKVGYFFKEFVTTYRVGSKIAEIKNKIVGLTQSLQTYGIESLSEGVGARIRRSRDLRRSYSHVVEEDFVGLGEEIETLVARLIDVQKDRVVSICGMGGLGKTTIARKLYSDMTVRRHFDGFAWTCISQQWDETDILQGILIKLIPEKREEIIYMRDEELVRKLHDVQLKKKCFVVLDDIWSTQAWDSLKHAFPNTRTGAGSKILVTSRNREVAGYISPSGYLYEPRFLTIEESWKLLSKKAIPKWGDDVDESRMDPGMEKLGKGMVERCCGLPLAILVLGGILVAKRTPRDWQMVSENINWFLARGRTHGQQPAVSEVLGFSYHDLPYQFKQCFLYMASLPEDFEIEAEKLYQLWLAEGIILQEDKAEEETMMDVAERYLAELAQRCMVQVNVKETAGGFKNCRLHDLMRDLCISRAKSENFSNIIDIRRDKKPLESLPSGSTTRRVSVYLNSNVMHSPVAWGDNHRIRSAFFYCNDCSGEFLRDQMKSHLSSFRLLRVLELQGFQLADELPKAIGDLIHLRYLSLYESKFKKLPSTLEKLIYLQTLDLEVDILLEIPNVLWKMERLQHLYLPSKFLTKDGTKLRLDGLSDLETLVNFNTSLCDVKDLDTLTNLRKLRASIKDKLEDMPNLIKYISFTQNNLRRSSLSISCQQFCSDAELSLLRTLFDCHRLYKLSISGRIGKLPDPYHFSDTIAKIAFKASALVNDPMATLEKLPKLCSLTFYDSAYMGEEMVCLANGFPRLLYLKLWGLPNLKLWRIDEGAMPKLNRLVVAHCDNLEMLPDGLTSISKLQKLNIRLMPDHFKDRLRTMDDNEGDFYKIRHVPNIKLD